MRNNKFSIVKVIYMTLLLLTISSNVYSQEKWKTTNWQYGTLNGMSFSYLIDYRGDCTLGTPFVRATLHSVEVNEFQYKGEIYNGDNIPGFSFPIKVDDGYLTLAGSFTVISLGSHDDLDLNKSQLSLRLGGSGGALTADQFRFTDEGNSRLAKLSNNSCSKLKNDDYFTQGWLSISTDDIGKYDGDLRVNGQALRQQLINAIKNNRGGTANSSGNNRQQRKKDSYLEQEKKKAAEVMKRIEAEQKRDERKRKEAKRRATTVKSEKEKQRELGKKIGKLGQMMYNQESYNYDFNRINYSTGPISSVSYDITGRYDFAAMYARFAYNFTDKVNLKNDKHHYILALDNLSFGLGASLFFGETGGNEWGWNISGIEVSAGFDVALLSDAKEIDDENDFALMYDFGIAYLWAENSIGFQLSYIIKNYDVGTYEFAEVGKRKYSDTFESHSIMFSLLF